MLTPSSVSLKGKLRTVSARFDYASVKACHSGPATRPDLDELQAVR